MADIDCDYGHGYRGDEPDEVKIETTRGTGTKKAKTTAKAKQGQMDEDVIFNITLAPIKINRGRGKRTYQIHFEITHE